jgi:hypothetical protein
MQLCIRKPMHTLLVSCLLPAVALQGAISFKTKPGAFKNKYKLEFWVYVGVAGWEGTAARVPDIQVSIRGTKGQCNVIKIYDVKPDAFEPMCQ